MKGLGTITSILTVVGAINIGLDSGLGFDLIGTALGGNEMLGKVVGILIGLSGVHQLLPIINKLKG